MSKNVAAGARKNFPAYSSASAPAPRWRSRTAGCTDASDLYAHDGARKYLNADERRRVLAGLSALPVYQALFVATLLWTGARVSEVLALTAASFQIERGLVAIRTLKRRRHAMREVPLPPSLIAALDRHFGLTLKLTERAPESARPLWPPLWSWCRQTAWRIVKGVMKEAGVTGRAATPRGLRHAFGIAAVQADVPLDLVSRWMGHSRLSTTAIYTAASGPEERAFAERFWKRQYLPFR